MSRNESTGKQSAHASALATLGAHLPPVTKKRVIVYNSQRKQEKDESGKWRLLYEWIYNGINCRDLKTINLCPSYVMAIYVVGPEKPVNMDFGNGITGNKELRARSSPNIHKSARESIMDECKARPG